MTICLDSNILSALFTNEQGALQLATQLQAWQQHDQLLIHKSVYGELLALPGSSPAYLHAQLVNLNIQVDSETPSHLWDTAGLAFAAYAERRRRSAGGHPRRILTDFLIGAHAQSLRAALCTLDPQHYQHGFPGLSLLP